MDYCEFTDIYNKIMEKAEKINQLKKKIEKEMKKDSPNEKLVQKWIQQIAYLGIGLDMINTQKPFTHV